MYPLILSFVIGSLRVNMCEHDGCGAPSTGAAVQHTADRSHVTHAHYGTNVTVHTCVHSTLGRADPGRLTRVRRGRGCSTAIPVFHRHTIVTSSAASYVPDDSSRRRRGTAPAACADVPSVCGTGSGSMYGIK
jgi:hypothetical protein